MTAVLRRAASHDKDEVSFGRFVNNPKVTPEGLCQEYWRGMGMGTGMDWTGRDILIYEDTSTFVFKLQANREDLSLFGPESNKGGFHIHLSLMADAQDIFCLGVGAAQMSKKEEATKEERQEKRAQRWKTPFEEKGTYRWFSVPEQAIANCPGAASYTVIGDREGDIYDVYAQLHSAGRHFLFRASDDRRVQNADGQQSRLGVFLEGVPTAFCYCADVAGTKQRRAHAARLCVKYSPVRLPRPEYRPDKSVPAYIDAYVVEIREDPSSVHGAEPPVRWVLLTTHTVSCAEDASKIIGWYCGRWNIEQHFRTAKLEGLDVGHSELETEHGLSNLAVLSLMASVKVMALVMGRGAEPDRKARDVFTEEETQCIQLLNGTLEGRTEKQKNPHPAKSFAFASWVVARLGGWKPGNKARPPGPITMLNGLVELNGVVKGYLLSQTQAEAPYLPP